MTCRPRPFYFPFLRLCSLFLPPVAQLLNRRRILVCHECDRSKTNFTTIAIVSLRVLEPTQSITHYRERVCCYIISTSVLRIVNFLLSHGHRSQRPRPPPPPCHAGGVPKIASVRFLHNNYQQPFLLHWWGPRVIMREETHNGTRFSLSLEAYFNSLRVFLFCLSSCSTAT